MEDVLKYLVQNKLEAAGIITTIICVWLNTKQNIWGWFWAIVASAIYGVVYLQAKLYSDMELQIVFIIISIYGWYQWLKGGTDQNNLPVSHTPKKYYLPIIITFILFAAISGYLHTNFTDASFPYFDSSLTAISLLGQWMLARKYLENWLLWITANLGYVAMYFNKDLLGTSGLYIVLLIIAIYGFVDWKKSMTLFYQKT